MSADDGNSTEKSSARTVAEWLSGIGMEQYAETFAEHRITLHLLSEFTDTDFQEVGVIAMGDREKLLREIAALSNSETNPPVEAEAGAGGGPAAPGRIAPVPPSAPSFAKQVDTAPVPPSAPAVAKQVDTAKVEPQSPATDSDADMPVESESARRKKRIKKLVITVILVSIGIHVVGGIGAFFWVVARYFKEPKAQFEVVERVAIKPDKREHEMETEEVSALRPKPVFDNRIQSLRPAEFALPDIPKLPVDQLVEIDTENLINENMEVSESQSTQGSGGGGGFFGGAGKSGSGVMEGTFYDLKQTKDAKSAGMNINWYNAVVKKIAQTGDISILHKYYTVPRKLYLTQIAIPVGSADQGPRAYGVSKTVKPGMWLVHYRGKVSAPESGKYRFVGRGDDVLLVRFNKRIVFDGCWDNLENGTGQDRNAKYAADKAGWEDLFIGKVFEVEKGEAYPIEVVLGEGPGGLFSQLLYIEKIGATYKKTRSGRPILPLFQMVKSRVPGRMPPTAGLGELWKPVATKRNFFNTMP